ncbi:hypothetical protein JCM11641_004063 [Rhodosporidiobolus odoratus]
MPITLPEHTTQRPRPRPRACPPWLTLPLLLISISAALPLVTASPQPYQPPSHLARRATPVPGVLFAGDYVCRLEKECTPCPPSELSTPLCKLYGNRRSLSCIPRRNGQPVHGSRVPVPSSTASPTSSLTGSPHQAQPPAQPRPGSGSGSGLGSGSEQGADSHPDSLPPPPRPQDGPGDTYFDSSSDRERDDGSDRGVVRVAGRQEAGRLQGVSEAEDEFKLAMEEVEAELEGAGSGSIGGTSGQMREDVELEDALLNGRRRRRSGEEVRISVDEVEYERLVKRMEKRQGGVQLKTQAWEACPRVVKQEREDFFEYVLCNFTFALVSLAILIWRQRQLALRQFGRLAARIMQTEISVGS